MKVFLRIFCCQIPRRTDIVQIISASLSLARTRSLFLNGIKPTSKRYGHGNVCFASVQSNLKTIQENLLKENANRRKGQPKTPAPLNDVQFKRLDAARFARYAVEYHFIFVCFFSLFLMKYFCFSWMGVPHAVADEMRALDVDAGH